MGSSWAARIQSILVERQDVFQRLQSCGSSIRRHAVRRGVGVSSLYAEVVARSGNFEVDTTPGKGTRFIIELPLLKLWSKN